jgi:N-acetylmuramoyl-L-alanine amidase
MKKKMKKAAVTAALALALSVPVVHGAINAYNENALTKQTQAVQQAAVIKQGSKGSEVKEVQSRLKKWGYYNGAVDGVYGSRTE